MDISQLRGRAGTNDVCFDRTCVMPLSVCVLVGGRREWLDLLVIECLVTIV